MLVQILVDNPNSWFVPYARKLVNRIVAMGKDATLLHKAVDVKQGDILALLSCERIFKNLYLNQYNLVVHASELPKGKGMSPLTWQILEGRNSIPVTLFEASQNFDDGPIYAQDQIYYEGHELISELRTKLGDKINDLVLKFIENHPNNIAKTQIGESTFYDKRQPKDSELNIDKSIAEQFNLLRVVDNERYPAFFHHLGHKYILKVEKVHES